MTHYTDHHAPQGLRTRGTVVVVPGRGETPSTYRRLAGRLAADAYRVRVVEAPVLDVESVAGTLDRFEGALVRAIAGLDDVEGDPSRPLVLVGADLGAVVLAALTARPGPRPPWWPDGLVLAGLPGRTAMTFADWSGELDARTACPVHRTVLGEDSAVRPGALGVALPRGLLRAADGGSSELPQLLLVGDADPLADRLGLARRARGLSRARLSVVRGAHHDVLNDLQHRSVAAEVVTFLEALRTELVPAVTVESSAW